MRRAQLLATARGPRNRLAGRAELWALALPAAAALVLAGTVGARHAGAAGDLLRGGGVSLVLFAATGDALAVVLVPARWRGLAPLFALPFGAAASGLILTVLGFAHVPLSVSVWVTLAGGGLAAWRVRRRSAPRADSAAAGWRLVPWLAAALVAVCLALIPAFRTGTATVPGENPDAHQVVGIAVLFQHVVPQGVDDALPIDTVPPSWRFRYSIFYPLAAASDLAHLDPIRVFPAMAALLVALAVLGFAVLAVKGLRAPPAAGPAITAALALAWVPLHLAWHPYWNQLWGLALMPWTVLFGGRWAIAGDWRAAAAFGLLAVALALAYPLALPYPLVLVGVVALEAGRRPRLPRRPRARRRAWATGVLVWLVLAPALAGAGVKLAQGLSQLLSAHSALWSGDISRPLPVGDFAGTGGGLVPAVLVLLLAAWGLRALPRRMGVALGLTGIVLLALDLRFRLAPAGGYMDFKHLSYVGMLSLTAALAAVARAIASGRRPLVAGGVVLALAFAAAVIVHDHGEAGITGQQVTPELLAIRGWAARLPRGASVRIDIPASGEQLWAVYMLGDHPVDAVDPVLDSTYAHAPGGLRADYSLAWRYVPNPDPRVRRPLAATGFAIDPPVAENDRYVLRRIVWPVPPSRYAAIPDTSSTQLVEP